MALLVQNGRPQADVKAAGLVAALQEGLAGPDVPGQGALRLVGQEELEGKVIQLEVLRFVAVDDALGAGHLPGQKRLGVPSRRCPGGVQEGADVRHR